MDNYILVGLAISLFDGNNTYQQLPITARLLLLKLPRSLRKCLELSDVREEPEEKHLAWYMERGPHPPGPKGLVSVNDWALLFILKV